ncbi:MAG: hypothetical protein ACOY3P_02800 [Planctomycetota bacterium]
MNGLNAWLTPKAIGRVLVVAGLVAGFLVLDFAIGRFYEESPDNWLTIGVVYGSVGGQLMLLAIWAVLGPGNFIVRLPWSIVLLTWMWCALVLGVRLRVPHFDLEPHVMSAVAMTSGLLIAQIPLWIARLRLGWRLVDPTATAGRHSRLQFGLGHLLMGMVFVALTLGALRSVLPANALFGSIDLSGIWFELIVFVGVGAITNVLVTLPWIWVAFQRARSMVGLAGLSLVCCAAAAGVEWWIYTATFGHEDWEVFALILTINLAQCVVVIGGLLPLRAIGFRIVRRERSREHAHAEA